MMHSSSAVAATVWQPPTTWQKNMEFATLPYWRKAGSAGGNTGRNTTIVRSNYLWTEAALLYEKSLKLWEGLSQDLNYNVMFSQRGVYNLGHSLQDLRDIERRVSANRLDGIDAEVATPAQIKAAIPMINISPGVRYPILGASLQRRGGVARHDAVAWGFARRRRCPGCRYHSTMRSDRTEPGWWQGHRR